MSSTPCVNSPLSVPLLKEPSKVKPLGKVTLPWEQKRTGMSVCPASCPAKCVNVGPTQVGQLETSDHVFYLSIQGAGKF